MACVDVHAGSVTGRNGRLRSQQFSSVSCTTLAGGSATGEGGRMSLDADPSAVAALVAGDPAGLEAIYRRYADRLYAYARSLLRDDESASDVVQETFVIAHERAGQLRDPARLASWLYTIVRNQCLARLRARRRTVLLVQAHEPILDTD